MAKASKKVKKYSFKVSMKRKGTGFVAQCLGIVCTGKTQRAALFNLKQALQPKPAQRPDYEDPVTYPLVPSLNRFADDRGVIQNLFTRGMQSGALITSKAGTRRADHYHKTGNHLSYLISGKLVYRWRPHGSNAEPEALVINPGEVFYSPEMTDHSMEFVEDSMFLAFDSAVARTPEGYDADIVKILPLGVPVVSSMTAILLAPEATP